MMTFHRLMIAASLFAAALALKNYLPMESTLTIAAVQRIVSQQEYALPQEAVAWMDWR